MVIFSSIRREAGTDRDAIGFVNRAAFGGPAEAELVDRLRTDGLIIASLVAIDAGHVVGHICFSRLTIHTTDGVVDAVALAPMAVLPRHQRQGIGSALVRRGLAECRAAGERIVIVLGHAEYYPRFGFSPGLARPLRSPYSGDAFMALELEPGALHGVTGDVKYPPPFEAVS